MSERRVNRIKFDKVKQAHRLLEMKAAYIAAEREIIADQSLTGWHNVAEPTGEIIYESKTVGQFHLDQLEEEMMKLIKAGNKALEEERYEDVHNLKNRYEQVKKQIDRLRGHLGA